MVGATQFLNQRPDMLRVFFAGLPQDFQRLRQAAVIEIVKVTDEDQIIGFLSNPLYVLSILYYISCKKQRKSGLCMQTGFVLVSIR